MHYLTSNFNLNIPFNKVSNNIVLEGSIGYIDSLNPDIKLFGNILLFFPRLKQNKKVKIWSTS